MADAPANDFKQDTEFLPDPAGSPGPSAECGTQDVFVDELFADRIGFERAKEKLATPHTIGYELGLLTSNSTGARGLRTPVKIN